MPLSFTHSLQGFIKLGDAGIPGVQLQVTDNSVDTTLTSDQHGCYSLEGLADGAYTITPSMDGMVFSPRSAKAAIDGSDCDVRDFVADSSAPVSDVPAGMTEE